MSSASLTSEQREMLLTVARNALKRAHAPYSNFHVGAAVLTDSGEVFSGCNVENASYGLTNCAETVRHLHGGTAKQGREITPSVPWRW